MGGFYSLSNFGKRCCDATNTAAGARKLVCIAANTRDFPKRKHGLSPRADNFCSCFK